MEKTLEEDGVVGVHDDLPLDKTSLPGRRKRKELIFRAAIGSRWNKESGVIKGKQ